MKRLLIIIMITLIGPLVRSEYSVYGQPYIDVEAFGEGFAVLEADGKIHFYNSASEQTSTIQTEGVSGAKFMCSVSDALVIAGETSLSCFLDSRWLPMDAPETSRITCLTAFYGGVMAATEDGKLLLWGSPFDKAQTIKAEVSGRFIAMSSFADRCYAVTDRAEIVTIGLNLHPSTFDFNAYYSEYYGEIGIVSVAAGATSVCITGNRGDESPAAFISSNGNVWSERIKKIAPTVTVYCFFSRCLTTTSRSDAARYIRKYILANQNTGYEIGKKLLRSITAEKDCAPSRQATA